MKQLLLSLIMIAVGGIGTITHAGDVTLQCDANIESDLAGYKLYYGNESGVYGDSIPFPLSELTDTSNPEFTTPVLPSGTYYFALTAYDTEGLESGYSNEVVTNLRPGAPGGFRIKVEVVVTVN